MSLLQVSHLAFRYASQVDWLFTDISFDINPGDRIGFVGPNGGGKTTLVRLLTGELERGSGTITMRQGLRIGYVPQESPAVGDEPLETYVFAANPEVGALREEIRTLESDLADSATALRYANLLSTYEARGGFGIEAEAARVLEGLGFDARERLLPMAHLSSGQRTRAELTKLLLSPTDLLLMDEPTNHLDIAAQEWLAEYLSSLDAAYLMVSHDRTFLGQATTRIFELRRGTLTVFEGDYGFYREQRALYDRQAWERYHAQQRRISAADRAAEGRMQLSRKVATKPGGGEDRDHFGRKASKVARTARILRERVAREPEVPKPWQEDPIPVLDFPNVPRASDVVLQVEGVSKSYGEKRLFGDLSFHVRRGERWAILGPNGTGKTTLLRILLGEERPDAGEVRLGAHVKLGYFAQEGTHLDLSLSPVALCRAVHGDETWVRTILGCLKLRGERANQPIGRMSEGERGKIRLAQLLLSGANVLLLDEPTNHLDIEAREAIEGTLGQFPGALLFVTHDRYFVEMLADRMLDLAS